MSDRPNILYLGAVLPSRSETFVYRELLALRDRGWRVAAASVHHSEHGLGDVELNRLARESFQVYGHGAMTMLGRASLELFRHPIRSVSTMMKALRDAMRAQLSFTGRLKILWQAAAALSTAEFARRAGIAQVHAHMAHVPTTIAMYLASHLRIPFSFTGHAADLFRDRSLLEEKLRRCSFCACISEWHRTFYHDLVPLGDSSLPVVRCGVDVKRFTPVDGRASTPLRILSVGRLVPKKGFDLLLEALHRLEPDDPAWACTIVGNGPLERNLRETVESLKLGDRVELVGAKSNDEVRDLLQAADIFVLPCRVDAAGDRDGIPVVLMEAMACGLPVISGDIPTIRELVRHGDTGLMVDAENIDELLRQLRLLLSDEDARRRLGRAGRAWVEQEFSLEMNIARLEAALGRTPEFRDQKSTMGSARSPAPV